MVNPNSGFVTISRAPEWKVIMYNQRTHLYYESTMEAWCRDTAITNGYEEWQRGAQWLRKGNVKVCGYQGTLYQIKGARRIHQANGAVNETETEGAQYIIAEGYPVNTQLATMMHAVLSLPIIRGLPLKQTYLEKGGIRRDVLNTYRIDRANWRPAISISPAA